MGIDRIAAMTEDGLGGWAQSPRRKSGIVPTRDWKRNVIRLGKKEKP